MGPWGPNSPVQPEKAALTAPHASVVHCVNDCCDEPDTCRCDCSWCDCRYAERMGS